MNPIQNNCYSGVLMRIFFNLLALFLGFFGVVCIGGSFYAAVSWVPEAEVVSDAAIVLVLVILIGALGAIFVLAAVRFFRKPGCASARDVAGLSCFLLWLLVPRRFFAESGGNREEHFLELLPLVLSILIAVLLYRLLFVRMIVRIYPTKVEELSENRAAMGTG